MAGFTCSLLSLISITPLPGPDRNLISRALHSVARACRVAAMITAPRWMVATPTISVPLAGRANRRPPRVLVPDRAREDAR